MLVKLYQLPDIQPKLDSLAGDGIEIRPARATEKRVLAEWVRRHFNEIWAVGCEVALEQRPTTAWIAVQKQPVTRPSRDAYDLPAESILGFACYDVDARGMFGPEGVATEHRGWGIGAALLVRALKAMAATGHAYAAIGWAGPTAFYEKTVGAGEIPDSAPGIFRGPLGDPTGAGLTA